MNDNVPDSKNETERAALAAIRGRFTVHTANWLREWYGQCAYGYAAKNVQNSLALGGEGLRDFRLEVDAQRGFEARKSLADLDVQAAQAAVSQANSTEQYAKANERLKTAVAARVDLEKTSVLTQRASADLTFSLANRQADVNGTNALAL